MTGVGLANILSHADAVVDVTNSPSFDDVKVREFFEKSTRHLLAAEAVAKVKHHVALSIVGADRIPGSGYMRAKVAQEGLIQSSGIPHTILRATQFFEFIAGIIAQFPGDEQSVHVPPVSFQPILSDDVVSALADVTLASPTNAVLELGGPERFQLNDVVRQYLAATGAPHRVIADAEAPYFGARLDEHALVPMGDARVGTTHLTDWLGTLN